MAGTQTTFSVAKEKPAAPPPPPGGWPLVAGFLDQEELSGPRPPARALGPRAALPRAPQGPPNQGRLRLDWMPAREWEAAEAGGGRRSDHRLDLPNGGQCRKGPMQ